MNSSPRESRLRNFKNVHITVCRDLNWVWQIKLLILITLLMPSTGTKVTDVDSSLDKNINSFSYTKNE